MKFFTILKLLVVALFASSTLCKHKLKHKQNPKFNGEFFSGFFSSLQAPATATKLDGYLKECGASSTSITAQLKKLNEDLKRIDTVRNPNVPQNTLIYVCDSVRQTLRAHLSIMRNCKLVYEYFKTYFDLIWKKILKSRQMGNDIVMDPVMKAIYSGVYPFQKQFNDNFAKNNYSQLGKIVSDLLRSIEPYSG